MASFGVGKVSNLQKFSPSKVSRYTVANLLISLPFQDKVKAASDLIVKLRSEKPSLVCAVEDLCGAYIDLAYHDVTAHKKQRGPIRLPSSCPLIKLAKLKEVAMPTMEIEVCISHLLPVEALTIKIKLLVGKCAPLFPFFNLHWFLRQHDNHTHLLSI